MASIAYITDQQMIEYHRLNGNHIINFWKPSNSKKICDFNEGDFLFFLAKGSEKGKKKEKGIIGYGKLRKSYILTFNQMWQKYTQLNGYPDKDSLKESILRITKNHKLPSYINCFELEQVVFFQAPVYLSEIGLDISNKVESYIYLDKGNMLNTSKILELAEQVGIDMWSSMYQTQNTTMLLKDAQISAIQNIYDKLKTNLYTTYEERCLYKYITSYMEGKEGLQFIGNSKTEFIEINQDMITVYLPVLMNTTDFHHKHQYILGHYQLYKGYIQKSEYHKEISVCVLYNQVVNDDLKEVLNLQNIRYKEGLVNEG